MCFIIPKSDHITKFIINLCYLLTKAIKTKGVYEKFHKREFLILYLNFQYILSKIFNFKGY